MSWAPSDRARKLADRAVPRIRSWLRIHSTHGLNQRRQSVELLADEIDDLLCRFDDLGQTGRQDYFFLNAALCNLLLALQSRPISRSLLDKSLKNLARLQQLPVAAAIATKGGAA